MTFENYKYTRPNLEETSKRTIRYWKKSFRCCFCKDVLAVFDEYNTLRRDLETQSVLVEIRHTIDTTDSFYEEEQNFWDDYKPELTALYSKVDKAIYNSKFKDELKKRNWRTLLQFNRNNIKSI